MSITSASTAGIHIATIRQYNQATGVATVVVPALYGDAAIEARPFLPNWASVADLPVLNPGDTVIVFYDGGNPMTLLRWYLTGGGGAGGGGGDEVWVGPGAPPGAQELWYDTDEPTVSGGGGAGSYVHTQATPASDWIIPHNLGYYPNVHAEDSAGDDIEGDIVHDSVNQLTLSFSAATAGKAYCS